MYNSLGSKFFKIIGFFVVSINPPLFVIIVAHPILHASRLVLPKGSSHLEQATDILAFLSKFRTKEFPLKLYNFYRDHNSNLGLINFRRRTSLTKCFNGEWWRSTPKSFVFWDNIHRIIKCRHILISHLFLI